MQLSGSTCAQHVRRPWVPSSALAQIKRGPNSQIKPLQKACSEELCSPLSSCRPVSLALQTPSSRRRSPIALHSRGSGRKITELELFSKDLSQDKTVLLLCQPSALCFELLSCLISKNPAKRARLPKSTVSGKPSILMWTVRVVVSGLGRCSGCVALQPAQLSVSGSPRYSIQVALCPASTSFFVPLQQSSWKACRTQT